MTNIPTLKGPEAYPLSGEKPKQIVILLHGLGANGNDLFGLVPHFAEHFPDAYFFSPDAPFPCDLAPVGLQWFSLRDRDEDILLKEVRKAEPIVNQCIEQKLQEFQLKPKDVFIIGFSQGGMLSMHTALRHKEPIAGVLSYSGALIGANVLEEEIKSKPEICLIHGEVDDVVPFIAFQESMFALQQHGVIVQGYSREELGHGIDPAGLKIGIEFMKEAMSKVVL